MIRRIETDILILGSGGAGLFAALHAQQANPGLAITVAVKGLLGKCGCTRMVQGGYNVALAPGDSIERHFMDTIEGGKWLPDQDLAWTLVNKAVERIHELENELGCFFDRNPDGSIHQKAFAGQTFDRTVHKGDLTGIEIINRLAEQVWARGIRRLEEHRAIELIRTPGGDAIAGVLMIDMRTGEFVFVRARAVLLGTGGGPTMYKFHTPSGEKTCDGLAMALRAGLALRDMEMVQFHPTGLLAGMHTRMTGTVLEEGLRGSGGWLLDGDGKRFMEKYDARLERATRDIVSRSIFREMRAGRTTPNGGVYIQMHHLGPDNVRRQFKGMVDRCADCGFDLAGGLVEVVPTAHYMMGGVVFRPDCSTELEGLFAAGEDTGGVHGANRLGGNGVANSTVFGGIAGEVMAKWLESHRARARSRRGSDRRERRRPRGAVRAQARRPERAARGALRLHVGRSRHPAHGRGAAPRPFPARRPAGRDRALRRGRRRPRLQPHLARPAQPGEPRHGEPRHRHRRARAGGFARRALPRGLSGDEFPGPVRFHRRAQPQCPARTDPGAGALLAREAGRVAAR